MTITTKYSLDERVWLMYQDKPVEGFICGLFIVERIHPSSLVTQMFYHISTPHSSTPIERREISLFKTKEELLKSL